MNIDQQAIIGTRAYSVDHSVPKRIFWPKRLLYFIAAAITATIKWVMGIWSSSIILSILLFIVINFYIFSSIVNLNSFFYSFLLLSLLTDGLYVLAHLPRGFSKHSYLTFDPSKLTIIIPCYNGEDVIAETIRQAALHVPVNQIVVVSDASTDSTPNIAKAMGAKVIQNRRNMNKAFSVSIGMKAVKTPYVLLLDDDTLIGNTFIPTSLLDDGYNAVAFNVMPMKENSLLNELQQFEYHQSMQLGKNVRANAGAIGNISGAIGLFKTEDLINQVTLHSGQFAGEDEQRTILVHLYGKGKGITYTDTTVTTQAPSTYLSLFRQRAYSWSAAAPEMFTLYWRILLSPRFHYLLKAEKAYQLYIYLTDPLRLLFFWALFTRASHLLMIYSFYLFLDLILWIKLRGKASLRSVLLYPLYSLGLTLCRFVGYFYWIYKKFAYLYNRLNRYAQRRKLRLEYAIVFMVIILSWVTSGTHFIDDMSLVNRIRSNRLQDISNNFNYDHTPAYGTVPTVPTPSAPPSASYLLVPVDRGDTQRAIAYKAIVEYLEQTNNVASLQVEHEKAYMWLAGQIQPFNSNQPGLTVQVDKSTIEHALSYEAGSQS